VNLLRDWDRGGCRDSCGGGGSDGKCGRIERGGGVERVVVSLYISTLYCLSCVRVAQICIVGMKRGQSRYGVHCGGLCECVHVCKCV